VKQKHIIWGCAGAVFVVTLGITSWRNGLGSSDEPSARPIGAASQSIDLPGPIPKHPFQAPVTSPVAPPPAQTTQSPPQPQPTAEDIPSPTQVAPATAPDPVNDPFNEQSQDDYKERAKLMEEIAARARENQVGR
jgi:hypothetical protein